VSLLSSRNVGPILLEVVNDGLFREKSEFDLGQCQFSGFMLAEKNQAQQEDKHDHHCPENVFMLFFDDQYNQPNGGKYQEHAGSGRQ
jgi:hypothetical protein